jgi:hypothetical protein
VCPYGKTDKNALLAHAANKPFCTSFTASFRIRKNFRDSRYSLAVASEDDDRDNFLGPTNRPQGMNPDEVVSDVSLRLRVCLVCS